MIRLICLHRERKKSKPVKTRAEIHQDERETMQPPIGNMFKALIYILFYANMLLMDPGSSKLN
jgi:hypothetical protein